MESGSTPKPLLNQPPHALVTACRSRMLLMKPGETQCQWILMDTNGNKSNTSAREGNVLEEVWDVYVDPLVGTQRAALFCTELLSPFCLIMP